MNRNVQRIENIAIAYFDKHNRTVKQIRRRQRRIWREQEKQT